MWCSGLVGPVPREGLFSCAAHFSSCFGGLGASQLEEAATLGVIHASKMAGTAGTAHRAHLLGWRPMHNLMLARKIQPIFLLSSSVVLWSIVILVTRRRRRRRVKRRIQSEIIGCDISFFPGNKGSISPSNHCFRSGSPPPSVTQLPPPLQHTFFSLASPLAVPSSLPLVRCLLTGGIQHAPPQSLRGCTQT